MVLCINKYNLYLICINLHFFKTSSKLGGDCNFLDLVRGEAARHTDLGGEIGRFRRDARPVIRVGNNL